MRICITGWTGAEKRDCPNLQGRCDSGGSLDGSQAVQLWQPPSAVLLSGDTTASSPEDCKPKIPFTETGLEIEAQSQEFGHLSPISFMRVVV